MQESEIFDFVLGASLKDEVLMEEAARYLQFDA